MTRNWLGGSLLIVAAVACQPKQPLQPSFFTQKQDNAPATCKQTLACYDACSPLTEECMLLCDQQSNGRAVEKARAVSYCGSQHGCVDRACSDERCAPAILGRLTGLRRWSNCVTSDLKQVAPIDTRE